MKDFHDLYTLVRTEKSLDSTEVHNALRAVFQHRKTPLRFPIKFDPSSLIYLQKYWSRYHQTVTITNILPDQIEQVIETVNQWLDKTLYLPQG